MLKEIQLRNGGRLSKAMISTALGIDGTGIFPRTLSPSSVSYTHLTLPTIYSV